MNKKKNSQSDSLRHLDMSMPNAGSSMDCTGLIPSAPKNDAEEEAYKDIYDYQAEIDKRPNP